MPVSLNHLLGDKLFFLWSNSAIHVRAANQSTSLPLVTVIGPGEGYVIQKNKAIRAFTRISKLELERKILFLLDW